VYLPTLDAASPRARSKALFPRHLFVFAWRIDRCWRRITSCPGVSRVMVRNAAPAASEPLFVPVVMTDEIMDEIQAIEATEIIKNLKLRPAKTQMGRRLQAWVASNHTPRNVER
jgi:hypothetical protein